MAGATASPRRNRSRGLPPCPSSRGAALMSNGWLLLLMAGLFLGLGYLGVPVAFSLIAGVLAATLLTPISLPSMIAQLFNGVDSEALLAVPFFLLVGELMTSANVVGRMINLSQSLIGHVRGGLAQVVTLFSMFFSGISGSSSADVAVLSRTLAPSMAQEGYDAGFTAALIASASTMANLIPPSIMAVVYGATGNVSIAGLFLGGVVPGVLVGIGLMIYSYFFGPSGFRKPRSSFGGIVIAAKDAALPLVIPVIIMGGILTGWFTPTEAGMVAVVYILVVAIPCLNWRHVRELPLDFARTGLLYSIPLIIIADFVDAIPAIIIFMPIINKLTDLGGINPVHMGVVIIVTLAFGLITPPYGLALLMASKFVEVRFSVALVRSLPLYVVFFATIAFSIFFPDIVLWLPKHVLPESVGCFKSPAGTGYICPG